MVVVPYLFLMFDKNVFFKLVEFVVALNPPAVGGGCIILLLPPSTLFLLNMLEILSNSPEGVSPKAYSY